MSGDKRFKIALSFPGEHREFVKRVADLLARSVGGQRVLYDHYYEAEFARPDLDTYLQRLYHDESELIAVFLCSEYEAKEWCGLEWRAVRDLIRRRASAIMPLRFDDTAIPGLFSIDGYASIDGRSPEDIAALILQRMGVPKDDPPLPRPRHRLRPIIGAIALVLLGAAIVSFFLLSNEELAKYSLYQSSGPLATAELQSQLVQGVLQLTSFKDKLPAWTPLLVSAETPTGTSRATFKYVRLPPAYEPTNINYSPPATCHLRPGLSWGRPYSRATLSSGRAQVAIDPVDPDSNYLFCVTFDGRLRTSFLEVAATDEVVPRAAKADLREQCIASAREGHTARAKRRWGDAR